MAQGNWVIMYSEGTRTPRGRQGTYKHGAARLAVADDILVNAGGLDALDARVAALDAQYRALARAGS